MTSPRHLPQAEASAGVAVPASSDAGRVSSTAGSSSSQALLMQLQRLHGNRAVTDLLARARGEAPTDEAPSQLDEVARGIKAARGGGQQLDGHTLARMNNAFGADFSGVRVHTDAHADRLNLAVEARAFATGRDIFFRQGTYNPGSSAGRELLAHELTHVVQQGGAGGLQAKLSVSEPGDPEEQEADRIASAVMAQEHCGRAGPVMGTASPLRAGNVLLHRDKDSAGPVELKPVAPTVDAPPAAAASNPADPADQVTLTWFVDWQNKEMGAPVSATSNARTGRDAAYGTLKLLPAAGAGNATTLPWVNAASSGGAVEVGAWQQAKGKGGMVSTGISWGRPPSAIATVSVEATTDGAKPPPKGELLAKQKAASSAAATALEKALELKGGLEMLKAEVLAAANGAVGGSSYKVSADVRLDPKPAYSRAVTAVPYEGAAADDRRTATVVVPTVVEKLKGSNTVEIENRMKQTDASQSASKDGKTVEKYDSKTESLLNEVTTNFTTIFNTAYQDWRSKIKKTSLSASGSFVGSVGGSAGASGTIDDLTIDFGTILGLLLIENPPLAFALKKAVGTGKLGGKGKVDFAAELKAKAGASASWSEEDVQQTLSKVDTQITHAISTHMRSMVESVAIKKSVETHDASKAAQTAKEVASSKKNAATAETVGVQYVIGEPELHITNG